MVELKQVLKVKREGRERHLGQTAPEAKAKQRGTFNCGWEVQLCTVKQNLTSLDRHGTSPDAAHSSPTSKKPLLDCNGNTLLGQLLFCTEKNELQEGYRTCKSKTVAQQRAEEFLSQSAHSPVTQVRLTPKVAPQPSSRMALSHTA